MYLLEPVGEEKGPRGKEVVNLLGMSRVTDPRVRVCDRTEVEGGFTSPSPVSLTLIPELKLSGSEYRIETVNSRHTKTVLLIGETRG